MAKGMFPVYKDHNQVVCFSCRKKTRNFAQDSGNEEGNGAFRQLCLGCRMFTYYDLEECGEEQSILYFDRYIAGDR